jgi:riboflavin kinase/FMN adenylyltransferase
LTAERALTVVPGVDALEPALGRLFIVIGVFDGIHVGHAYLLDQLRRAARDREARPTVITFDHHPDEILQGTAPPLLSDPDERLDRLAAAGVEVAVVQTFDVALRMTPFDAFVHRIADRVGLAGFLMTPESAFGHDRGGTPETVAALGRELGYEVVVVPPLEIGGRAVRSSDIRAAIAAGDLAAAARLLGHPYAVVGSVAHRSATISGAPSAHGAPAADSARPLGATRAGAGRPERRAGITLTFSMPVAIPPPGTYGVEIERVDDAGGSHDETSAIVTPGQTLEIDRPPPMGNGSDRLRVIFVDA